MSQTLYPALTPAPPCVAIIVPAYNAEQWLAETLHAIKAQTMRDWVTFIADDGSTDDTAMIVKRFMVCDSRFRLISLPANSGGPARPRNLALERAESVWIAFCDADDLWHPRKLELQLQAAHAHSADLVCSAIRDFTPPAPPPPDAKVPENASVLSVDAVGLWRLLGKNIIPNSSVLCRRTVLCKAGGFDPNPELVTVEDYDLWLRVLEVGGRAVKLRLPLVHYRRLASSVSSRKTRVIPRVLGLLRRHFVRTDRAWLFPMVAPFLMASYAVQATYLRLWRGRL